jgi:hypothetical protein
VVGVVFLWSAWLGHIWATQHGRPDMVPTLHLRIRGLFVVGLPPAIYSAVSHSGGVPGGKTICVISQRSPSRCMV